MVNGNLKKTSEVCSLRDTENMALKSENKQLKDMLDTRAKDSEVVKANQKALLDNLRMQLEETKEMNSRIKQDKEREFRKLREKCDEEIRRETDKYQFEYDKLREEIQMFQRKLNQEENVNQEY